MTTPEYSDIPAERWLPIEGFEDYYEISDHGRVKSYHVRAIGKLMKLQINWQGYPWVGLRLPGDPPSPHKIHRLVARHFLPKPTDPLKTKVLHADSVPANCHYQNLRWGTQKENMEDKSKAGNSYRGTKHWNTTLTPEDVLQLVALSKTGIQLKELAEKFGIKPQSVRGILKGNTWSHVTGIPRRKPWR